MRSWSIKCFTEWQKQSKCLTLIHYYESYYHYYYNSLSHSRDRTITHVNLALDDRLLTVISTSSPDAQEDFTKGSTFVHNQVIYELAKECIRLLAFQLQPYYYFLNYSSIPHENRIKFPHPKCLRSWWRIFRVSLLFIVIIVQPRNTMFPFHKNIIWLHRNHKEIMAEN